MGWLEDVSFPKKKLTFLRVTGFRVDMKVNFCRGVTGGKLDRVKWELVAIRSMDW